MAQPFSLLRSLRRRSVTPALAISAVLLFSSSAHAEPSAAEKQTAKTLVAEGKSLLDRGDAKAAFEKFSAAHAILRAPTTAFEVATALATLGLLVEAREMAHRISERPAEPGEPPSYRKARADAKGAVEALDSRIPSIHVRLYGALPKDVTLTVDNVRAPPESLTAPLRLNPGRHEIVASAKGYRPAHALAELIEGALKPVDIQLTLEPLPPPEEKSAQSDALVYVGASLSVALAIAGAGTAVGSSIAAKARDDYKNPVTCPSTDKLACPGLVIEQENKRDLLANTAIGLFLGAGTVGLGTLIYALARPASQPEPPSQSLWIIPTAGGAVIGGTF